ncbi:hypothetical protein IFM89_019138 [Coptis chinensis]|uniref:Uncharacterized protein n=1 Tax=Coptis chinensis TaxID=261450 RepID=A0A835H9J5_9MAGN|nr:hypothetical protein IFM89_019138 [Coptis chinensis]
MAMLVLEPTIDLNFVADVLQLDTMEVEPDNVHIKTLDGQPEVEQLKDYNQLSAREERASEVCLDKLLEVMSVYWWLYDQTLKTGHAADLTVRVYGRGLSINLSTYQLLRQYQWLNHENHKVLSFFPGQGYFGVHDPSGQSLQQTCTVYMESLYATIGDTLPIKAPL